MSDHTNTNAIAPSPQAPELPPPPAEPVARSDREPQVPPAEPLVPSHQEPQAHSSPTAPEPQAPFSPHEPLKRVKPRVEWRSFSGWFALFWLADIGWLGRLAMHRPEAITQFPWMYVAKVGGTSLLAFLLSFAVPIALLDDSSHNHRAWWVAWLWPPIMVTMLATDVFVVGFAATRLYPLVELLKNH